MEGRFPVEVVVSGVRYHGWVTLELIEEWKRSAFLVRDESDVVQPKHHPGQTRVEDFVGMIGDHIDGSVVDRYAEARRDRRVE